MKKLLWAPLFLSFCAFLSAVESAGSAKVLPDGASFVDAADFGAKGDGVSDDTEPINAAIKAARGRLPVLIRESVHFYRITGKLDLAYSGTHLILRGRIRRDWTGFVSSRHADQAGRLLEANFGSASDENFLPRTRGRDIIIDGQGVGVLDGNSRQFEVNGLRGPFVESGAIRDGLGSPHAIAILGAERVRIRDLKIVDSTLFACFVGQSKYVRLENLLIRSGRGNNSPYFNGKNQDGIHLVDCVDFTVAGCDVESSDDNFAFTVHRAVSRNGLIRNCRGRQFPGDGGELHAKYRVRAANLRFSSETPLERSAVLDGMSHVYLENMEVRDCEFLGGARGLLIEDKNGVPVHDGMRLVRQLSMKNVSFSNYTELGEETSGVVYADLFRVAGVQSMHVDGLRLTNTRRVLFHLESGGSLTVRNLVVRRARKHPWLTYSEALVFLPFPSKWENIAFSNCVLIDSSGVRSLRTSNVEVAAKVAQVDLIERGGRRRRDK